MREALGPRKNPQKKKRNRSPWLCPARRCGASLLALLRSLLTGVGVRVAERAGWWLRTVGLGRGTRASSDAAWPLALRSDHKSSNNQIRQLCWIGARHTARGARREHSEFLINK